MGVRLYTPTLGRFLTTDPVFGGNDTTYGYPTDPINMLDLDGRFNWGRALKVGLTVGSLLGCTVCTVALAAYSLYRAYGSARKGDYKGAAASAAGAFGGVKALKAARGLTKFTPKAKGHISEWREYSNSTRAIFAAKKYALKHKKQGCVYDGQCRLGGHVHARYIRNGQITKTIHFSWKRQ